MLGKYIRIWGVVFCLALCLSCGAFGDRAAASNSSVEEWLSESFCFSKRSSVKEHGRDVRFIASALPHGGESGSRSPIAGETRTASLTVEAGREPVRNEEAALRPRDTKHEGTLPGMPSDWLFQSSPLLDAIQRENDTAASGSGTNNRRPALVVRSQLPALITPVKTLKSVGAFPGGPEAKFTNLEIVVDQSQHSFKLTGRSAFGKERVLYQCRIGLGSGSFPTPTGQYFVTHIYDDNPWWIPPANRAWAWGQSPSRTVYGGTMAPLLKKKPVRSRSRKTAETEDKIYGKVKLQDYGYRFHGTNAPSSIGRNQSHGCVRMLPKDAAKVARLIIGHVGTVERRESENGEFAVLKSMVRLRIIK